MSYLDRIERTDVATGPYIGPNGREVELDRWHLDAMHDPSNVGADEQPVMGYVSMSGTGPRGGYYGGPTFYSRELVDAFIAALEQARDRAFPDESAT